MKKTQFECTLCCKYYKSDKTLKYHSKMHCSAKMPQCHVCGIKFTTKYYLIKHIKLHTNKQFSSIINDDSLKPYNCHICSNKYMTYGGLKGHLAVHLGKKFKCSICFNVYKYINGLQRHIKNMHTSFRVKIEDAEDAEDTKMPEY